MTFDGSAHDSHQHQVFIDTVDNTFFEEFIPFLVRKYGLTKNLEEVIRVCTMSPVMYANSTFSYEGVNKVIYEIEIEGTTFSGHPTRTTLGNSLRTLSYVAFLAYISGFHDLAEAIIMGTSELVYVYVAGDDVIITGFSFVVERMFANLNLTHASDLEAGVHGLG